jgi:hypothetical protein
MVTFGKLHFVVLAANATGVVDEHGAIENVVAHALSKAKHEAHVQFVCEPLKANNDRVTDLDGYVVHFRFGHFAGDDFIDNVPVQCSFRSNGDLGASLVSISKCFLKSIRVTGKIKLFGHKGDRGDPHPLTRDFW